MQECQQCRSVSNAGVSAMQEYQQCRSISNAGLSAIQAMYYQ